MMFGLGNLHYIGMEKLHVLDRDLTGLGVREVVDTNSAGN